MSRDIPVARVGILGGGQLGRMMIYSGLRLGIEVHVLDPNPDCPCRPLAARCITADLYDADAIEELAREVDVLTYEIEHVNTEALEALEGKGMPVFPRAGTLRTVQNKLRQRQLYERHSLPGPEFTAVSGPQDPELERFGFPSVQKLTHGGYDGRGVARLESADAPRLKGSSLLERTVAIERELAVVCVRDAGGRVVSYPVCEMEFDPSANICRRVSAPAQVSGRIAAEADEIARKTVTVLGCVGVCAVELFLDVHGRLFVNEAAPRPHNSGHLTIEAADTSQFEQHLRAVLGLPLGSTRLHTAAVMVNLLGQDGAAGKPRIRGLSEALATPGLSLHLYGKKQVRSGRKMGHFTVIAESLARARELALHAEEQVTVGSES